LNKTIRPAASSGHTDHQADPALLEVRDLRTQFAADRAVIKAVDGVSFDVKPGSSIGIVGESGSGKSVAALSIMRLIEPPGAIVGGSLLFKSRDLVPLAERDMRKIRGGLISFVPQNPMSALNPVYTVGKQLEEAIAAHQVIGKRETTARALELLKLVGIPAAQERFRSYPHNMSGGMLQRIVIAMAVANEPDLLILDEPTTALDVTIQAQILDLISDLRARTNAAVLLITHDFGVIAEVCEDVVVMYGGKVMERATVAQVMNEPKHPYTKGLLSSVPSLGMKGKRLNAIAGSVPSPLNMPPGCPFAPRCPDAMDACQTAPALTTLDDGRDVACWLYG
jgi:oligopeptide/dipeptide ABC transporter ATP-binding protein